MQYVFHTLFEHLSYFLFTRGQVKRWGLVSSFQLSLSCGTVCVSWPCLACLCSEGSRLPASVYDHDISWAAAEQKHHPRCRWHQRHCKDQGHSLLCAEALWGQQVQLCLFPSFGNRSVQTTTMWPFITWITWRKHPEYYCVLYRDVFYWMLLSNVSFSSSPVILLFALSCLNLPVCHFVLPHSHDLISWASLTHFILEIDTKAFLCCASAAYSGCQKSAKSETHQSDVKVWVATVSNIKSEHSTLTEVGTAAFIHLQ